MKYFQGFFVNFSALPALILIISRLVYLVHALTSIYHFPTFPVFHFCSLRIIVSTLPDTDISLKIKFLVRNIKRLLFHADNRKTAMKEEMDFHPSLLLLLQISYEYDFIKFSPSVYSRTILLSEARSGYFCLRHS
jgi:hypothetical protein